MKFYTNSNVLLFLLMIYDCALPIASLDLIYCIYIYNIDNIVSFKGKLKNYLYDQL